MAREVGCLNSEIQGVSNETLNPLDNDSQNGIACYSPQCPKATSKLSQKSGWNGRLTLKHYSLQSYYAEIHGLRSEIAIAVTNSVNCNPYFLSGLDACLLIAGHQRCSKRWVVRGEGKLWSVGGSEVG